MIYDHSLVDGWRSRIGKEELASRDSLRKFIVQRKGVARPTSAPNNLKYNERNGPWGNGGNFADARLDQPFNDMQDRRLKDNINVWEQGFRPQPTKAISPAKQKKLLKEKKEMEDKLHKANKEDSDALVSARTNLTIPDEALIRISPLTELNPEPHVKGCKRSWQFLENDPVKIQLRQEDALHTQGSLEQRTMHRLSPLMKLRPQTPASQRRPVSAFSGSKHFRPTEEGYGHIGEDGTRGDVRMGWISQNMVPTQEFMSPKSTARSYRSRSSVSSRASSAVSRVSRSSRGKGRRRQELENLISRVKSLEVEIDDVRAAREDVEDELEATRTQLGL